MVNFPCLNCLITAAFNPSISSSFFAAKQKITHYAENIIRKLGILFKKLFFLVDYHLLPWRFSIAKFFFVEKSLNEWLEQENSLFKYKAAKKIRYALIWQTKKLKLNNLDLSSLPSCINQLTHLTDLNLSRNLLTELPPEIGQLTNLTTLDLWRNQLTELPSMNENLTKDFFEYLIDKN